MPKNSKNTLKPIKLGILGCGTVGTALIELIAEQANYISAKTGTKLEVAKIGVKDIEKERSQAIPKNLLTQDLESIVNDENIDMVVELMGGIDPTKNLVSTAFSNSKLVVTANKELLATYGKGFFEEGIAYEASVAGAVPIIKTLHDLTKTQSINRIAGILNGTTNYILSSMSQKGISYSQALAEATDLGYAEANPEKDISGQDACAKIAILARLAFGLNVDFEQIYCEGIYNIDIRDIEHAKKLGYTIKLLAITERSAEKSITERKNIANKNIDENSHNELSIAVYPALVPNNHQLAQVNDSYNAIFINSSSSKDLMLYGRGAGGTPTASAVLGDIITLIQSKDCFKPNHTVEDKADILPVSNLESGFYLRLEVEDNTGVLAAVTKIFEANHISVETMTQLVEDQIATLVIITHNVKERDLNLALEELTQLESVKNIASNLRVSVV